ncbi:MAG: phosphatase, partial [Actinomycetota bacterium]
MTPEIRASLRAHLLRSGMAGDTRTTRENTVSNARKLAEGDPDKHLGIGARGRDHAAVMKAVAKLCGCDPSCDVVTGAGVIDPDRTLDELQKMGDRLERAARAKEPALIVTGHPTGLLAMYMGIARAFRRAGVPILTPLDSVTLSPPRAHRRRRAVRYHDGVGTLMAGADLIHTHDAWPMEALLQE